MFAYELLEPATASPSRGRSAATAGPMATRRTAGAADQIPPAHRARAAQWVRAAGATCSGYVELRIARDVGDHGVREQRPLRVAAGEALLRQRPAPRQADPSAKPRACPGPARAGARSCALMPVVRESLTGCRDEAIPRQRAAEALTVIPSERSLDRIQGVDCAAERGSPAFVAFARIGHKRRDR